ncbi:MAG: hypothetical protein HRT51_12435 [Colwellia sp.]|nr:hypothetical protein [Colwellia sp.]
MWLILALSFSFTGSVLVYISNKNQRLIKKNLSQFWRKIGYCAWLLAFFSWYQTHVMSASLFLWFFTISIMLMIIPLLSLMLDSNKHKGSQ